MKNYLKFCLFIVIFLGIYSLVNKVSATSKRDVYFFDGITFKSAVNLFDYIDKNGYQNTNRMEFAYEDYLSTFPESLVRYKQNVAYIGVVNGRIERLPNNISEYKMAIFARFADQKIIELPKEIGEMKNLETLIIGGNELKNLPPEIGKLSKLKTLKAFDNQLIGVPKEIGNLEQLEVLDLHSNKLTSLPKEISGLKNLKYLFLGGNNIEESEKLKIKNNLPNTKIYF